MTTKTRIVIAGPESAGRDALASALCVQVIAQAELFVADTPGAFDPEAADICIWCTATFDTAEAREWDAVPSHLKGRSFLVPVADPNTLEVRFNEAQLARLQSLAGGAFHGVFPIVLGAPSGSAHAELATVLLEEIAIVLSGHKRREAKSAHPLGDHREKDPLPPEGTRGIEGDTDRSSQHNAIQVAARLGLAVLAGYSDALTTEIADDDPETIARVLSICSAAADELAEAMHPYWNAEGPISEMAFVAEDTRTAADSILLLSVEGGVEQAVCAVTTLLQLRRDLEALDAA